MPKHTCTYVPMVYCIYLFSFPLLGINAVVLMVTVTVIEKQAKLSNKNFLKPSQNKLYMLPFHLLQHLMLCSGVEVSVDGGVVKDYSLASLMQ